MDEGMTLDKLMVSKSFSGKPRVLVGDQDSKFVASKNGGTWVKGIAFDFDELKEFDAVTDAAEPETYLMRPAARFQLNLLQLGPITRKIQSDTSIYPLINNAQKIC